MNTQSEPLPQLDHTIVLLGLKGSGKSKIGRRLAERLQLPFFDSDTEFEAAAGCSISEYFTEHGEAAFREGERKVIERLMEGPPCVLSTGGGAFCDESTRHLIKTTGYSLWLRAELDLLVRRTAGRDHRPLLKQGNPRDILARLIEQRHPLYEQADMVVDTTEVPPDVTLEKVLETLTTYLKAQS